MDSDEGFFKYCIEEDDGISDCDTNDKENKQVKSKRRENTKKEQYELIRTFVKEHTEESLGKEMFTQQWDNLTMELNKLGPPTHSTAEWRKIWSEYKYNHQTRRQRSPSNAPHTKSRRIDTFSSSNPGCSQFQSDVLNILKTIVEQQQQTNDLLKKLVEK